MLCKYTPCACALCVVCAVLQHKCFILDKCVGGITLPFLFYLLSNWRAILAQIILKDHFSDCKMFHLIFGSRPMTIRWNKSNISMVYMAALTTVIVRWPSLVLFVDHKVRIQAAPPRQTFYIYFYAHWQQREKKGNNNDISVSLMFRCLCSLCRGSRWSQSDLFSLCDKKWVRPTFCLQFKGTECWIRLT